MNAAHQLENPRPADYMAVVRTLNRMRRAGFILRLDGSDLAVSPFSRLTDAQRAYIRAHKSALVELLTDAGILYEALQGAGAAGLDWQEGTPQDWPDARLLAAGEVLYADGRMVSRLGRRYATECRPPVPDLANVIPIDREAYEERAAIMEFDGGLQRGEAERKALALALRAAELQTQGWSAWNAKARAESEALPGWEVSP